MRVKLPEDEVLKERLSRISTDESLTKSVMKTFEDVIGSYISATYAFGDYYALIGSKTFIDRMNNDNKSNSAMNYFNHIDDAIWSNGVLAICILLGLDSQEQRPRSIYWLSDDLKKLKLTEVHDLEITEQNKQLLKDYRNHRVAHWDYRNTSIKNLHYDLPINILNKTRTFIMDAYYAATLGCGHDLITVRGRSRLRAESVASLFGVDDLANDMIKEVSSLPEEKWMTPGGPLL